MKYKAGTILKFKNNGNFLRVKVTSDSSTSGIVIESNMDHHPVGSRSSGWSWDSNNGNLWSVDKEYRVRKLLKKIDRA